MLSRDRLRPIYGIALLDVARQFAVMLFLLLPLIFIFTCCVLFSDASQSLLILIYSLALLRRRIAS